MTHDAIYATHPTVVTIDDTDGARDKDGNLVILDLDLIQKEVDRRKAEYERTQYARKRAESYPAIGDQLDAILKGFNTMRLNGTKLPQDLDDLLAKWLAVKAKYTKPE